MVTILTLFLGLATGAHQVELSATAPVAHIELWLDGERVGVDDAPPWDIEVDLGDEPAPHRLTAVGFDAEGAEVARTSTAVNLRPRETGLSVLVDEPAKDEAPEARMVWGAIDGTAPSRLSAWLDGEPIEVATGADRFERLPLPEVDLSEVHFLTVEMVFGSGTSVRAERVFGGEVERVVNARNTAVAIEAGRRHRLDSPAEARGMILAGGEPAEPVGLEDDGADLILVRDRSAARELAAMSGGHSHALYGSTSLGGRRNDRLFLVSPGPLLTASRSRAYELFPVSPALSGARGSLLFWLARLAHDPSPAAPEEIAGAVSVAGMLAVSGGRPRTVLLVIGPESPPVAVEDAERTRRFLARLGVPLAVWRVQREVKDVPARERMEQIEGAARSIDRRARHAEARAAWGEVADIASLRAAAGAVKELHGELERQQVVWIDGEHLPTEITLAPGAEVRLVGREP